MALSFKDIVDLAFIQSRKSIVYADLMQSIIKQAIANLSEDGSADDAALLIYSIAKGYGPLSREPLCGLTAEEISKFET